MEYSHLFGLNGASLLFFSYVLYRSFSRTFITELHHNTALLQRNLASIVLISALWSLQASLQSGLYIHFLGSTALVLMFKWRRAIWIGTFAAVLSMVSSHLTLPYIGLFLIGTVLIPMTSSYLISYLVHKKLPHHLFIYLFISAFLNGAITILVKQFSMASLLWWNGNYEWHTLVDSYLLLTPLLLFPEALLNGMTITLMSVYRPDWLVTFNQSDYLSD